jgi:hypothetical protein
VYEDVAWRYIEIFGGDIMILFGDIMIFCRGMKIFA